MRYLKFLVLTLITLYMSGRSINASVLIKFQLVELFPVK